MTEQMEILEKENAENTELIIIKQMPEFEQSFIRANAEITKRLADLKNLDISEETKIKAKKVRTELNKELEQFEERRKSVKKEINKPYEELEKLYKGYISEPYKNAISELTDKISQIEKGQIDEKRGAALEYFTEYRDSLGEDLAFLEFERLEIPINLTASCKKIKEEIREKCDEIKSDIDSLKTMGELSERYIICYRNLLDAAKAIGTVNEAAEEERRLKAAKEQVKDVSEVTREAEVTPAHEMEIDETDEIFSVTFTVRGKKKKLTDLKQYIIETRLEIVKI